MFMLVSMTLTLTQDHSGSAEAKQNQRWMISTSKQAISISFATTVGHFLHDLDCETFLWLNQLGGVVFFARRNSTCCRGSRVVRPRLARLGTELIAFAQQPTFIYSPSIPNSGGGIFSTLEMNHNKSVSPSAYRSRKTLPTRAEQNQFLLPTLRGWLNRMAIDDWNPFTERVSRQNHWRTIYENRPGAWRKSRVRVQVVCPSVVYRLMSPSSNSQKGIHSKSRRLSGYQSFSSFPRPKRVRASWAFVLLCNRWYWQSSSAFEVIKQVMTRETYNCTYWWSSGHRSTLTRHAKDEQAYKIDMSVEISGKGNSHFRGCPENWHWVLHKCRVTDFVEKTTEYQTESN